MSKVSKKSSVLELEKEVELLRSYVIGTAGKDSEGSYRPEFVEKVLRSLNDEVVYEFKNSKDFLNILNISE